MKLLLGVLVLAAIIGQANAVEGFVDGNKLLGWCAAQPGPNRLSCMAYVAGVSDTFDAAHAVNNSRSCTPAAATLNQIVDVVLKYLNQHPEQRHLPASALVMVAIAEAWCKSQ
jgi:Rap1a immunity proteins